MEECHRRTITLHPDEDWWMSAVGNLNDLYPDTEAIDLYVTSVVEPLILQDNIRMLFTFKHLKELSLNLLSSSYTVDQRLFTGLAELYPLTKLSITCGTMPYDVEITALTSLRNLKQLTILPFEEYGLVDDDIQAVASFSLLEELTIRPSSFGFTDNGLATLTSLKHLQSLSLCPLSSSVSPSGMLHLKALPNLRKLEVGLTKSSQSLYLSHLDFVPQLCLKTRGADIEVASLLSVANWCLPHNLVSLSITPSPHLPSKDILISVNSLVKLTALKLAFTDIPDQPPATPIADLSSLSALSALHHLQLLSAKSAPVKVTVKSISLAALSWPHLTALTLSCMASPYLLPEALDLLDNFTQLRQLCLCAEAGTPDSVPDMRYPLNFAYLPPSLTHLSVELADISCTSLAPSTPRPSSNGSAATRYHHHHHPYPNDAATANGNGSGSLSRATSGGSSNGMGAARRLLPALEGLEVVECRAEGDIMGLLLQELPGLRYLDLADVEGLTDASMKGLRTLARLTHLSVRAPGNKDLTAAPILGLSQLLGLKHLEWCTDDTYTSLDIGRLAPTLCTLSNLRFLSLATKSSAVRERSEGWWAVLQKHLPYCTFSLDPALQVTNAWDDCTSLS